MITLLMALAILATIFLVRRYQPSLLMILAFVVGLGITRAQIETLKRSEKTLSHWVMEEPVTAEGTVISQPKSRSTGTTFILQSERLSSGSNSSKSSERIFIMLKKGEVKYKDRVQLKVKLRKPSGPGFPGDLSFRDYLWRRGTTYSARAENLMVLGSRLGKFEKWMITLRQRLITSALGGIPDPYNRLLVSIIYGNRIVELPDEMEFSFRRAGLTHILVVSGTQISLLVLALSMLFIRIVYPASPLVVLKNIASLIFLVVFLGLFGYVTNFEITVLRAIMMSLLLFVGRILLREPDVLQVLSVTTLALLLVHPFLVYQISFQLSFCAVFAICYFNPPERELTELERAFPRQMGSFARVVKYCLYLLWTSFAVHLSVLPILAYHFNRVSLWGLITNLIAIPVSFLILILGVICNILSLAVPFLSQILIHPIYYLLMFLNGFAEFFARIPFGNFAIQRFGIYTYALYILSVFYAYYSLTQYFKRRRYFFPLSLTLIILSFLFLSLADDYARRPGIVILRRETGATELLSLSRRGRSMLVMVPRTTRSEETGPSTGSTKGESNRPQDETNRLTTVIGVSPALERMLAFYGRSRIDNLFLVGSSSDRKLEGNPSPAAAQAMMVTLKSPQKLLVTGRDSLYRAIPYDTLFRVHNILFLPRERLDPSTEDTRFVQFDSNGLLLPPRFSETVQEELNAVAIPQLGGGVPHGNRDQNTVSVLGTSEKAQSRRDASPSYFRWRDLEAVLFEIQGDKTSIRLFRR